jgi:hypothetical protein
VQGVWLRGRKEGGARKFCPRGWRERESPPPAQRLSAGAPPPERRTGSARSSPPPPTAAVLLGVELRRLLPGAANRGWKLRVRGEGARVLAVVASWPPPRSGWRVDARRGLLPFPREPPKELRPLPARHPGARAGNVTQRPGSILPKPMLPRRAGGGGGSRRVAFPSAASAVPLAAAAAGLHAGGSRCGHRFLDARERSRGEERTHTGSRRPLAWRAPGPPRLAALTLAAGRSHGAST